MHISPNDVLSQSSGPRARAFINMHAQSSNAGDALVLRELVELVSTRVPTDLYLGDWPDSFVGQLRLAARSDVTAHRGGGSVGLILNILRSRFKGLRCYYFLTAGAPHGERSPRDFAVDMVRILWLGILKVVGVRICQVGVSFENIGRRHACVLRWRSRLLHASVPRDRITFEYMQSMGIKATGTMPDVTMNMFSSANSADNRFRPCVAFSFRTDKYSFIKQILINLVNDACDSLPEDDMLVFVAQVERDVAFMRDLAEIAALKRPGGVRFVNCVESIDSAFDIYSLCRVVYSNRLHALLPSLRQGAAPVALIVPELDPKIAGVFDSIGLSDCVVDIRTASLADMNELSGPARFDGVAIATELNDFFDDLLEVEV